ncbi:MAG: hypothetical protein PHR21_10160 [Oscillospiraceae bacterium]|nr:hypothetical protein [Oscillospiraceae bacterium]MDD4368665.1 hypothetical protein [Oscillospiraceae bacterium]
MSGNQATASNAWKESPLPYAELPSAEAWLDAPEITPDSAPQLQLVSEQERRQNRMAMTAALSWLRVRQISVLQVAAVSLFLCGIIGFLLNNQARLLELNYSNASLTQQIETLRVENTQLMTSISTAKSEETYRSEALALGLQTATSAQTIYLDVPSSDRLIVADNSSSGSTDDSGTNSSHLSWLDQLWAGLTAIFTA